MDAVEYLNSYERLCDSCSDCHICPISRYNNKIKISCEEFIKKFPQMAVAEVEKWAKAHPIVTRQSKMLEVFPQTAIANGVIDLCPLPITNDEWVCDKYDRCAECRKAFWLEELKED